MRSDSGGVMMVVVRLAVPDDLDRTRDRVSSVVSALIRDDDITHGFVTIEGETIAILDSLCGFDA